MCRSQDRSEREFPVRPEVIRIHGASSGLCYMARITFLRDNYFFLRNRASGSSTNETVFRPKSDLGSKICSAVFAQPELSVAGGWMSRSFESNFSIINSRLECLRGSLPRSSVAISGVYGFLVAAALHGHLGVQ